MAISNAYWGQQLPTDFAGRLRRPEMRGPAYSTADPGMVAQPYADPGNALPNIDKPNLVQPEQQGQEIKDYWHVGGPNALTHPLLLELLRQRPDLAKHFMQQNQLMIPQ